MHGAMSNIPTAISIFVLLIVAGCLLIWVNGCGMSGMPGMSGVPGSQGKNDMYGMSGMNGMSGMSGMYGTAGMSGMSGMPGMTDRSGADTGGRSRMQQQPRSGCRSGSSTGNVAAPGTAAGAGMGTTSSPASGNGVAAAAAGFDVGRPAPPGWLADVGGKDDLPLPDGSWGADAAGWGGPGRAGSNPVRAVGGFMN